jgi:hypothetical protein
MLRNLQLKAESAVKNPAAPMALGKLPFQTLVGRYGTPRFLKGRGFRLKPTKSTSDPVTAAMEIAQAHRDLFGMGKDDTFKLRYSKASGGHTRVVLDQLHQGVPVSGGGLYLLLDKSNEAVVVGNTLVPDIQRSPTPTLSAQSAEGVLSAKHANFKGDSAEMLYRPSRQFCDTARLTWRVGYKAGQEPRVGWIDAHDGTVLDDRSALFSAARTGVYQQTNGTSDLGTAVKACSIAQCPTSLTGKPKEICEGLTDLWDFWANASLHGGAESDSYDDNPGHCLFGNLTNLLPQSQGSVDWPVLGTYIWASANLQTKGIFAHEYGHELIKNNATVPTGQTIPVCEHIADMQAYAIDNQNKITYASGCTVRDWQNPSSVTTTCEGETVHFPSNFDGYNWHSFHSDGDTQPRADHYTSWHVPSTMWSHLIYKLAQKPGLDRQKAASVVFRTLRKHMPNQEDFSLTGYQFWLLIEAELMGTPYDAHMHQLQREAHLWSFGEHVFDYCYSRPGMTFVWNSHVKQLRLFYDQYIPPSSDKLMMAYKTFNPDQWSLIDTGLSPSTIDSGLTAGYAYQLFGGWVFLAWRGWDDKIYFTRKEEAPSGTWSAIQAISGITTTHQPVIAVGSSTRDEVRLFYRDMTTGYLRYLVWQGSSWGTPTSIPGTSQLAREPAVTWDVDQGTYIVLYIEGTLDAEGEVRYVEITPSRTGDSYSSPVLLRDCAYTTGPHYWSGQISAVVENGKLNLVGIRDLSGGYPRSVCQAVLSRDSGDFKLWHHTYTERDTDEIVVRADAPGIYATTWTWSPMGSYATVYTK